MIRLENVTKKFNGPNGEVTALDNASLRLSAGDALTAELLFRDKRISPYFVMRLGPFSFEVDPAYRGLLGRGAVLRLEQREPHHVPQVGDVGQEPWIPGQSQPFSNKLDGKIGPAKKNKSR